MSSQVRSAVVGLGRQGQRHLMALSPMKEARVVAVCDLDPRNVRNALDQFPAARGYVDFLKMLHQERPQFLSIATHAPLHREMVFRAAREGVRHILCEKPMTVSLKDADEMIKVCKKYRVKLAVNHCRRWGVDYARLKEILKDGRIGKIVHLHYTCGGGRLGSNGGHAFDLMRYLSDSDPVEVIGVLDTKSLPDPRGSQYDDPGGFGQILFKNGTRGTIDMSQVLGVPPQWEITCTDGRISIDEMGGRCTIFSRERKHQKKPSHARLPLLLKPGKWSLKPLDIVHLTRKAIQELISNVPVKCNGVDGCKALEVSVAFHLSSRKGRPVRIPLRAEERRRRLKIA